MLKYDFASSLRGCSNASHNFLLGRWPCAGALRPGRSPRTWGELLPSPHGQRGARRAFVPDTFPRVRAASPGLAAGVPGCTHTRAGPGPGPPAACLRAGRRGARSHARRVRASAATCKGSFAEPSPPRRLGLPEGCNRLKVKKRSFSSSSANAACADCPGATAPLRGETRGSGRCGAESSHPREARRGGGARRLQPLPPGRVEMHRSAFSSFPLRFSP